MSEIKSKILAEVEESLGSHAVMVVADAMEKCPTLKGIIDYQEFSNKMMESAVNDMGGFRKMLEERLNQIGVKIDE